MVWQSLSDGSCYRVLISLSLDLPASLGTLGRRLPYFFQEIAGIDY